MIDKQHCFMNEADFEPFERFYNFQSSIKERALRFQKRYGLDLDQVTRKVHKDGVEELVYFIPKLERTLTGMVLPDGRILGHKEYRAFFDQNLKPKKADVEKPLNSNLLSITENGETGKTLLFDSQRINSEKTSKAQLM